MISCCFFCVVSCFFFKQKTAYEMRISDWSSDVCSSDLDDEVGSDLGGQVDHQLGEAHHLDVVQVAERLLDHLLALLQREERLALLRVAHGGDHDVIEDRKSTRLNSSH